MKPVSLKSLWIDELRDLYDAETQLVSELPRLARAVSNSELRERLVDHFNQTQIHMQRLETIFKSLKAQPSGKQCKAMNGLVAEIEAAIKMDPIGSCILDAALIGVAQKVEHFEIAGYGCVHAWAIALGRVEEAKLLLITLKEEKEADKTLSQLAEGINKIAMQESDEPQPKEPAYYGSE